VSLPALSKVEVSNLLQTSHPIFQKKRKKPYFPLFSDFFTLLFSSFSFAFSG